MVEYASGSIHFSGLGSDTDWQDMINKLYSIESRYANQLLRWKADWQKRLDAFKQVRSEMLNLQTSLNSINSINKFLAKSVSSSDEKVATAIANADAQNGTYAVEVNQLASQYSWTKNTNLFDKNAVLCDDPVGGTFQYSYQGVERSLSIPRGTTLEGLKNLINNDSQNRGVRAQLITTQSGIVFQLNSKETGSANTLVLQKTDGMSALGTINLTNQKYIEAEGSMTLVSPTFTTSDGVGATINTDTVARTFVFTIDGKRASISVPPGEDMAYLLNAINTWGHANVPSKNTEDIASLVEIGTSGVYRFTLAKKDTVYGPGTYDDPLHDVVTRSYTSGAELVPDGTYILNVIPPNGTAFPVTALVAPGGNLQDLHDAFKTALAPHNVTVALTADPANPSNVKLSFGPAVNTTLTIPPGGWNSDADPVNTSGVAQVYEFRISSSDLGAQAGDLVSITVPSGSTTLRELTNSINAAMGNKGSARLVQNSSGKWDIVMETRSVPHQVTVEDGTLASMSYALPQEASGTWLINKGENAQIRVNGWPGVPEYMESASNNIPAGAVIDGISLSLRSVGNTTITVANDTQKIADNVTTFVTAVNSMRSLMASLTAFDEKKATVDPEYSESLFEMQKGSILTGNYGVQIISSRLKSLVANTAAGFLHQNRDPFGYLTGDVFSSLSQIGITTNAEQGSADYGLLQINSIPGFKGLRSLEDALAQDAEAVARLFSSRNEGVSNNQNLFQYNSHIAGVAQPGTYDVEYTIGDDGAGNPIITAASINGKSASYDNTLKQITLTGPAGDPARSISLNIYDLTIGVTQRGSVSIKDGKVNELLSALDGSDGILGYNGSLTHLEENYQNVIKNIDKKIQQEDDRLKKWRRSMNLKFSRLETVLGKYNQINEGLKSQLTQLNKSDS